MGAIAKASAFVSTDITSLLHAFERAPDRVLRDLKQEALKLGLEAYHISRATDGSHFLISYLSREGDRVTAFTGKYFSNDPSKNEFRFSSLLKSGVDATDGLVRAITLQNPLR